MKAFFYRRALEVLLVMAAALPAQANSNWLTMVGNPVDPDTSTIEVYVPASFVLNNQLSMNVRVNRAKQNVSSDGIPFRSYTATILVDCVGKSMRFTAAAFYLTPLWEGNPHKVVSWSVQEVRPVLFRNFEPNPKDKIFQAACPKPAR